MAWQYGTGMVQLDVWCGSAALPRAVTSYHVPPWHCHEIDRAIAALELNTPAAAIAIAIAIARALASGRIYPPSTDLQQIGPKFNLTRIGHEYRKWAKNINL